jgi:hypothetical protein
MIMGRQPRELSGQKSHAPVVSQERSQVDIKSEDGN